MTAHLVRRPDGFELRLGERLVLEHGADAPAVFLGRGRPRIAMNKGNFRIEDRLEARLPLAAAAVEVREDGARIALAPSAGAAPLLELEVRCEPDGAILAFRALEAGYDRFWLRLRAEADEAVWGGGEQMSYLNLRGRRFPLWTSEPGVGRDKSTRITFEADRAGGAGGDYYTTNYPQPTFLSSRRYALHAETTAYAAFDFEAAGFHEVEVWEVPERIELFAAPDLRALVRRLSDRFGRPAPYPDWALEGAVVGLKAGAASFARLAAYEAAGCAVAGLWCEDWVGVRETSFGRRLFWDWRWDPKRYPGLDRGIGALAARGIRFLGYVNPYLCVDGGLYPEAERRGYLALRPDADQPYLVDFGEFTCGIVDFTHPEARLWFEEEVIGRRMLDFGLSGWMADFGEYLPHDVRLHDGLPGMLAHNAWPALWAEVNARAVAARGRDGDALFFMRAGWTGVQRSCPLLWAGDQSVDFSRHDGLPTVICAALSAGLVGNAFHHSDIGGYTSLYGNVRTRELLMRWAEMAAFTPMMRTHEGNRPDDNLQIDQDAEALAHFARMTRVFRALAPYVRSLRDEAARTGLPLQRPLFLEYEAETAFFDEQTSYLYGSDLLVAPVIEAGAMEREVRLPAGARWRHLWTGDPAEGTVRTPAPFGRPPVFVREGSPFASLFDEVARL